MRSGIRVYGVVLGLKVAGLKVVKIRISSFGIWGSEFSDLRFEAQRLQSSTGLGFGLRSWAAASPFQRFRRPHKFYTPYRSFRKLGGPLYSETPNILTANP